MRRESIGAQSEPVGVAVEVEPGRITSFLGVLLGRPEYGIPDAEVKPHPEDAGKAVVTSRAATREQLQRALAQLRFTVLP